MCAVFLCSKVVVAVVWCTAVADVMCRPCLAKQSYFSSMHNIAFIGHSPPIWDRTLLSSVSHLQKHAAPQTGLWIHRRRVLWDEDSYLPNEEYRNGDFQVVFKNGDYPDETDYMRSLEHPLVDYHFSELGVIDDAIPQYFIPNSVKAKIIKQKYRNRRLSNRKRNERHARFGDVESRSRTYSINDVVGTDFAIFDSLRRVLMKRVTEYKATNQQPVE